jgi:hypothetical protein
LKKYDISATWAIVGHLFLDECKIENNVKHSNIPRSQYSWYEMDWFAADPCTNLEKDPIWYGKDIVDKIINCSVYQEIACHSFSHILFGDKHSKRETVQADLRQCIDAAKLKEIEMESFVFPRNSIGYIDELANHGFKCFRGLDPVWYENFPSKTRKVCHIIDQLFSFTPPVSLAIEEQGLLNVPGSMIYLSRDGFRKYIPIKSRVKKAKKGIHKAATEKKIFHLWFHPFNIATDPENLLNGLEEIIKEVDALRKKGELSVKTMGQIK